MATLNKPLVPKRKRMSVSNAAVHRFQTMANLERGQPRPSSYSQIFQPAELVSRGRNSMAIDSCLPTIASQTSFLGPVDPSVLPFATKFIGYPALSMLRQNIIIQNAVATYAQEMTKKWVEVKGDDQGNDNKAARPHSAKAPLPGLGQPVEKPVASPGAGDSDQEKGSLAEDAKRVAGYGKKWKAEALFRSIMEEVGFSGGCLVFIDNGDTNLAAPMPLNKRGIPKGSIKGFRILEPMNCYALNYNASNPLSPDYFVPTHWMILNQKVHASRLLYFTQNNLPFLLKPAYNFFGVPIPQMILDYLYNFERSRDAAARLIRNYSKRIISTDMSAVLVSGLCEDGEVDDAMDVESIFNRVRIMQLTEDNDGYLLLDKDREQFDQITTSLSGMMEMVSQQMELVALVLKIPVTKLFGTPPRGFNATGDAEKEDFANFISGMRKQILQDNVEKFYKIIQLSEAGYVVEELEYTWPDLREATEEQKANIRQLDAQTGSTLVQAGIIDAIEERQRLAATEDSGYQFIDAEDWEEPLDGDPFGEGGESQTEEDASQGTAGNGVGSPGGEVSEEATGNDRADAGGNQGGIEVKSKPRLPLRPKTAA